MKFCLQFSSVICLGAALSAVAAENVSFVARSVANPRVRSVVRVDSRSGRLVRTVVVSPRVVQPASVPANASSGTSAIAPDANVPEIVEQTARKYDVDPLLVHSVIQVESGYNAFAVSPKGAQGIMQLMPGTARRFGVENAFDVRDAIDGGVRYLKYLQTLFPQDIRLAVAAYNAGEAAVWKYNNQIPPYRETEQYVYKVGKRYGDAKRAAGAKPKLTASAAAPDAPAAEPTPAPVEHFIDSEGRLIMRNVSTGAGEDVSTP